MFSLICVWISCWVNNGEAGDFRRHRAYYDVIVIKGIDNVCLYSVLLRGTPGFALTASLHSSTRAESTTIGHNPVCLRCPQCTLLFKSNGIYFSNAYLIYWSSISWSKLLTWHLSGVLWGWCDIFICLWFFVASIWPFKVSKVWKTRYQNACNWDSFWGLFHYTRQIAMGNQIISISWDKNEARAKKSVYVFRVLK